MDLKLVLKKLIYPWIIFVFLILLWIFLSHFQTFKTDAFPTFSVFIDSSLSEIKSGRLISDTLASFFRMLFGFTLSALVGIPAGLLLGKSRLSREILLPAFNFLRSLSPLAWIPFAVIWFGIGDLPVIFLIFLGCVFPLMFATFNAVLNTPKVYDQLAVDFNFQKLEYWQSILIPALMPQIVSSLRLVAALAWIILVPAEMLAGQQGLGYAILDARNGMRSDLLVLNMVVIGLSAQILDRLLEKWANDSKLKWSYEQ